MVGINVGEELTFLNDMSTTSVLENDIKIRFKGEVTLLSLPAKNILFEIFGLDWKQVRVAKLFEYNGEL